MKRQRRVNDPRPDGAWFVSSTPIPDGKGGYTRMKVWTNGKGEMMSIEERDKNRAWVKSELALWGIRLRPAHQ